MPPTNGNINPAATTPARKQHPANRLTVTPVGRPSDMYSDYSWRRSNSVYYSKFGAAAAP
jgi:hypothetical protein